MVNVLTRSYKELPVDRDEILRYAGVKTADGAVMALMEDCIKEVMPLLNYRVCYTRLRVTNDGDSYDLGGIRLEKSAALAYLDGATSAVVLAATVGTAIDRLILRYSKLLPSRAVMIDAIGSERIEALCDAVCEDVAREASADGLRAGRRFSPGYGAVLLDVQRNIFSLLEPMKHIGVALNASLSMSPSKSVTAFTALSKG